VGEGVKGGIYGEYPSLESNRQEEGGNLKFNLDFRSVYTTVIEDWFHWIAKAGAGELVTANRVAVSVGPLLNSKKMGAHGSYLTEC